MSLASVVFPSGWSSATRPYRKKHRWPPAKPLARYGALEGALPSDFATSVTYTTCRDTIGPTREEMENIRVMQRH
jgi:hypothetical protein